MQSRMQIKVSASENSFVAMFGVALYDSFLFYYFFVIAVLIECFFLTYFPNH